MKSLKHILGLLMMTAMIIAAGCNKEENGGKKENLPHPTSTYKACPILAHIWNDKLGIKEIQISDDKWSFNEEQRVINYDGGDEIKIEYKYDKQGRVIEIKEYETMNAIHYDVYGFVDSIYRKRGGEMLFCRTFKYSNDTVFETMEDNEGIKKYVVKFSDDLYPILQVTKDGLNWRKWSWKDGNMISYIWHDSYGNGEEKYQYDNSYNISKLIAGIWVSLEDYSISKNNIFDNNISYTYNERGLVETITRKDDKGNIIDIDYVSYIYY